MTMNARPEVHSGSATRADDNFRIGVARNCDFSLFSLFFQEIISGRPLVFGGNPWGSCDAESK